MKHLSFLLFLMSSYSWAGSSQFVADLNQIYQRESSQYSAQQIQRMNRQTIEEVRNFYPKYNACRASYVEAPVAENILNFTMNHPVVSDKVVRRYDPDLRLGFCFGRALFVHLELLRRGVSKDSIKKVFLLGPMSGGAITWQFHVATVVKGPQEIWWVIDTYFGKLLRLEDWYEMFLKKSKDGKLRLYITDPNRIGADPWKYNIQPGGLLDYNGYFQDVFAFFKNNPVPLNLRLDNPSCRSAR